MVFSEKPSKFFPSDPICKTVWGGKEPLREESLMIWRQCPKGALLFKTHQSINTHTTSTLFLDYMRNCFFASLPQDRRQRIGCIHTFKRRKHKHTHDKHDTHNAYQRSRGGQSFWCYLRWSGSIGGLLWGPQICLNGNDSEQPKQTRDHPHGQWPQQDTTKASWENTHTVFC